METTSFFKRIPLFSSLSTKQLMGLAQVTESIFLERNDLLFEQGDPGDALYLIREGMVSIRINDREVGVLGCNECLGELAVIDGTPRSASAHAITEVRLLGISSENFKLARSLNPSIAISLMRTISQRLREREADSIT